jgi:hypothetical protein
LRPNGHLLSTSHDKAQPNNNPQAVVASQNCRCRAGRMCVLKVGWFRVV